MSDGVSGTPGMGRTKLKTLAFLTLTTRLTPLPDFLEALLNTQAVCETLVARGRGDTSSAPFTTIDCAVIAPAYAQVGISSDLIGGERRAT